MKNILILGGLGFIGSNLIEEFLKHDDFYLIVFDFPGRTNSFGPRLKVISGDFSNEDLIDSILRDNRIDIVIHLISNTIPASSNENIVYDIEANLIPTIKLLRLLSIHKVNEIVFFSSGGSIYGPTSDEMVNEGHPTYPISSHGVVKLTIEKYIHLYHKLYGVNFLNLRVGNPYGPYQSSDKQGIINVFIRKILNNEKLIVRGDGSSIRDYIYVKDLAKIVNLLLKKGVLNETINIGSGKGTSVNQIISILSELLRINCSVDYSQALHSDVPQIILDINKLEDILHFEQCDIRQGIKDTLKSIMK